MSERLSIRSDFGIFAKHGQIFAQIQLITEFRDACMPLANLLNGRRHEQPIRERVFSHASAGRGEKLEQSAFAENIEIGGINVMGIVETIASATQIVPAAFNTCQTIAVKIDRALGEFLLSQNARMIHGNYSESGSR